MWSWNNFHRPIFNWRQLESSKVKAEKNIVYICTVFLFLNIQMFSALQWVSLWGGKGISASLPLELAMWLAVVIGHEQTVTLSEEWWMLHSLTLAFPQPGAKQGLVRSCSPGLGARMSRGRGLAGSLTSLSYQCVTRAARLPSVGISLSSTV